MHFFDRIKISFHKLFRLVYLSVRWLHWFWLIFYSLFDYENGNHIQSTSLLLLLYHRQNLISIATVKRLLTIQIPCFSLSLSLLLARRLSQNFDLSVCVHLFCSYESFRCLNKRSKTWRENIFAHLCCHGLFISSSRDGATDRVREGGVKSAHEIDSLLNDMYKEDIDGIIIEQTRPGTTRYEQQFIERLTSLLLLLLNQWWEQTINGYDGDEQEKRKLSMAFTFYIPFSNDTKSHLHR